MAKKNEIIIQLLNEDWVKRAHPLLMIFKGGHKAKAGEWFLEVNRVLYDVYKTFAAIQNFLNRGHEDLYIGENKVKIELRGKDRLWAFGYMVENAYLRIGSCLEKIAQMVRVYYEHPGHGGKLYVVPKCGKCPAEELNEHNCSFGALVKALHTQGRVLKVDNALFALESSKILSDAKKARNDISHRINKTVFYPGLDPSVDLEIDGKIQKTTFTLGKKYKTPEEHWRIIAEAHNEIVSQLNIIGPKVFPKTEKRTE